MICSESMKVIIALSHFGINQVADENGFRIAHALFTPMHHRLANYTALSRWRPIDNGYCWSRRIEYTLIASSTRTQSDLISLHMSIWKKWMLLITSVQRKLKCDMYVIILYKIECLCFTRFLAACPENKYTFEILSRVMNLLVLYWCWFYFLFGIIFKGSNLRQHITLNSSIDQKLFPCIPWKS